MEILQFCFLNAKPKFLIENQILLNVQLIMRGSYFLTLCHWRAWFYDVPKVVIYILCSWFFFKFCRGLSVLKISSKDFFKGAPTPQYAARNKYGCGNLSFLAISMLEQIFVDTTLLTNLYFSLFVIYYNSQFGFFSIFVIFIKIQNFIKKLEFNPQCPGASINIKYKIHLETACSTVEHIHHFHWFWHDVYIR